jgi:hypothetical protein
VICNFVCVASWVVFPAGLVEPVELHGIQRGHVGPARGTGGTAVGRAPDAQVKILPVWFHQSHRSVPPKSTKLPAVPPVPRSPGAARRPRSNESTLTGS